MNFESKRPTIRTPDDDIRAKELAANAQPGAVALEKELFATYIRAGRVADQPAQQRLFAALRASSTSVEVAVQEMNTILNQFEMRGALVPVERSTVKPETALAPAQPIETERWVSWKLIKDEQGQEIPGSIEKILIVNVRDEAVVDLVTRGGYDHDFLSAELTDEDRSLKPLPGSREILLPKFDQIVTTAQVEKWFEANQLFGLSLQELLASTADLPAQPRSVYWIALDEAWRSRGRVPTFTSDNGGRNLFLNPRELEWNSFERFPATRKENLP